MITPSTTGQGPAARGRRILALLALFCLLQTAGLGHDASHASETAADHCAVCAHFEDAHAATATEHAAGAPASPGVSPTAPATADVSRGDHELALARAPPILRV